MVPALLFVREIVLKPSAMWNASFSLLLGICFAVAAGLTGYAWSWLGSIGAPLSTFEGYSFHAGLALRFVLISSVVLLIFANFLLARFHRAWAMWLTFVYFAIFIGLRYFFLEPAFIAFQRNNLAGPEGGFLSFAPFVGAVIIVAGAAIVFIDQLIVVRLREVVYPSAPVQDPSSNNVPPAETADDDRDEPA